MTVRPIFRVRRWVGAVLVAAAVALGAPAAQAQLPTLMSPQQELEIGRQQHPKILQEFGGALQDPKVVGYVDALGQKLARLSDNPSLAYTFTVLNSDIVNAFALPGGYVYVTRGLLALVANEAELAGVLGHEIGHITARHSAQRYTKEVAGNVLAAVAGILTGSQAIAQLGQGAAGLALAKFSRDDELQADEIGIKLISRAGYEPLGMANFLTKLGNDSRLNATLMGQPGAADRFNWLQTHPLTDDRVREARTDAQAGGFRPASPRVGRDEYLAAVDGMAYGGDERNGIIRNREFAHLGLGIRFEVPPGFKLFNGETQVTARGPDEARIVFDRDGRRVAAGQLASYLTRTWATGVKVANLETLNVNGFEAVAGTAQAQNGTALRLVAIRYDAATTYRFIFAAPPQAVRKHNDAFRQTTYSFRRLTSDPEAGRTLRLQVVTVGPGDSVDSMSRRMGFEDSPLERFLVLNGLQRGDRLALGDKVKIIAY